MPPTAKTNKLSDMKVRAYMSNTADTRPLHDGGGLYLRKRSGKGFWYLRMTEPGTGKEQWHRMFPADPRGVYPQKSLADARAEAVRLWSIRNEGIDPRAQREMKIAEEKARQESAKAEAARQLTLRQVFDRWRASELQPIILANGKRGGRKDGGAAIEGMFALHVFPKLGAVPMKEVRKADLLAITDSQKAANKLRSAQLLFGLLRQMLKFALDRELIDVDPLAALKKSRVVGSAVARERFLTETEIIALHGAIPNAKLGKRVEPAIWLLLATGARIGELMGATWADPLRSPAEREQLRRAAEAANVKFGEVDTPARTWHLPDTKNQRPHTIHLSDFAVAMFERLRVERVELTDGQGRLSPWVFPARDSRCPLPSPTLGKQLADRQRVPEKRLGHRSKSAGSLALPGGPFTPHDLRRTAATLMAGLGVSGDVVDETMNHVIASPVRRVYIRDRREAEQAKAFDALGAKLAQLTGGNVVPIKKSA